MLRTVAGRRWRVVRGATGGEMGALSARAVMW